ncbi:MAG: hypothetical protein Q8T09_18870 [Candidatus Melainabacteria bacterium]|nr:hypothetical protein [Candidatus Melainabacteria bacterium]
MKNSSQEIANRLSATGRANVLMIVMAALFVALAFWYPHFSVGGANYNEPPTPTPPPVIIITPPQQPFRPPIIVPTDVTSPQLVNGPTSLVIDAPTAFALNGVQLISDSQFPKGEAVNQTFDWITVLAKDGAQFTKPNNYTCDLKSGDILVSVKSPSKLALVITPLGTIAIGANGDVMVCYNNGVLRVMNFDGEGKAIKVQLDKGPFAGDADPTVVLACGYELIAGQEKITRSHLRPKDGIARRYQKVLENGHLAVSEFSLESAINSCDMLVDLQQKTTGVKERRILSDMSKMAAVLNYKNSSQGYTAEK